MSEAVVGSVAVEIVPAASNFGRKLRDALLPDANRIGEEVGRQLSDRIQSSLGNVRIQVDTTGARAEVDDLRTRLNELGAGSTSHRVEIDTARARADLDALRARLDELGATTTRHRVEINQSGSSSGIGDGSLSGGFGVMAAGLSLLPALIPVAASAIPVIEGIGMAAVGAGAGLGVLALAFHGIGAAVSALGKQSSQTGQQLAAQASQQLSSADSILNAQDAVRAAVQGVADAQRSAALSVRNAEQGVIQAEQTYTASIYTEQQAQLAVIAARKAAAQQLQDLSNQVKDGALSQRQATLDLQSAQQALTVVDFNPHSTQQQRDEAQLAVDQAKQHLAELGLANQRLAAQKAIADKQGVANAPTVVAAEHSLADAQQSRVNAQKSLVKAQADVVEARRAGAEQIGKADLSVIQSERALEQAYAAAAAAGTTSANAVDQAMANLSPAGQAFAHFVNDQLKPAFKTLTDAAQEGFLPGLQSAIQTLLPYLPNFAKFVGDIAREMANMVQQAAKALTGPFWSQFFGFLADMAKSSLPVLGAILGNLAVGFAGLFEALAPASGGLGGGLEKISKAFADWSTHLGTNQGFQKFLQFIKDNAPAVGKFFVDLAVVVAKLIVALAPLGAAIAVGLEKLFAWLSGLSPGQLIAIAAGIGAIAIAIMLLVGGPVTAVVLATTAIVGGLVYAYTHFKTFHDIVDEVWHAVATGATWLWQEVLKPTFNFIVENWHYVATSFKLYWDYYLHPVLEAYSVAVLFLWNDILKPTFAFIVVAWHNTAAAFSATYNSVLKPVWSAFSKGFSNVSKAFGSFRDGLSTVWGDIKTIFTDGYNFVTQNVLNKFIDAINKVTSVLGVPKISDIPAIHAAAAVGIPSGSATGRRDQAGFAHGGVVPGYAPGVDSFRAMLSPGEGVLVPEAVQALGPDFIHSVNRQFSNRTSSAGHFAGGGIVGAVSSAVGAVKHAVGNVISGAEGAALNLAESPIKDLIRTLSPQIVKQLAEGGFNQIDKGIRAFIGAHPKASSSGSTASVSGPNSGSATDYAKIIINQAKSMNLGPKGAEIGLMTALVESNLKNYANANIPESLRLPHDAVGSDHFSAGLFQQQTGPFGNYWGSVAQVMNPAYSAHRFFDELLRKVPGYLGIDSGVAAQTVQVSAFPDAYDRRRGDADDLISRLKYDDGGFLPPGVTQVYNGTGKPERVFTDDQWQKLTAATRGSTAGSSRKFAENLHLHGSRDEILAEMDRRAAMQSLVSSA